MATRAEIGARIARAIDERRLRVAAVAERADVGRSFLYQVISGANGLSASSLARVAAAIGVAPAAIDPDWKGQEGGPPALAPVLPDDVQEIATMLLGASPEERKFIAPRVLGVASALLEFGRVQARLDRIANHSEDAAPEEVLELHKQAARSLTLALIAINEHYVP